MRVILVTSAVEPVGVATHILNLASMLAGMDLLDTVLCPGAGWLTEQLAQKNLPYSIINLSYQPRHFISSNLNMYRFLGSRKSANIVHLHGRFPLFISVLSLFLKKSVRFTATVHQFASTGDMGKWQWKLKLENYLLKRLGSLCCVSGALKKDLALRLGQDANIDVIPNWIEPTPQINSKKGGTLAGRGNPARLCGIGRLAPEKGFDILVAAIEILWHKGHEVCCDIYGAGPMELYLKDMIAKKNLGGKVFLKGVAENIRSLLPEYDVLVIPSRMESFGLVALEGYDAEVPIVAGNVDGLNEVVLDKETGLLFEKDNPSDLAAKIIQILESENIAPALTEKGRKRLENYVPNQKLQEKYNTFYGGLWKS